MAAPAAGGNPQAVVFVDPEYLKRKQDAANKVNNAADAAYEAVVEKVAPLAHQALDKSLGASEKSLAQQSTESAPASLQGCVAPVANSAAGCIVNKAKPAAHAALDKVIEQKVPGAMHASIDKTCDAVGPSLNNKGCI
ncbi:MAG: hypothetical protein LLG04_17785 [Parachlamydia sp.]|nr:hypothetical protein [Parachlamydia sp.]